MGLYDQPAAGELRPRRWDAAQEYTDTYPVRVPPQWVTFGAPPPRASVSPASMIVLIAWIVVGVLQVLGAFGAAARAVLPFRD